MDAGVCEEIREPQAAALLADAVQGSPQLHGRSSSCRLASCCPATQGLHLHSMRSATLCPGGRRRRSRPDRSLLCCQGRRAGETASALHIATLPALVASSLHAPWSDYRVDPWYALNFICACRVKAGYPAVQVTILERTREAGKKVLISGGARW